MTPTAQAQSVYNGCMAVMTAEPQLARRALSVAAAICFLAAAPHAAWAQIDAGYLATVTDLKETTTYLTSENATEVSLALTPPEPGGGPGITLIFRARFTGRELDVDRLAGIVVRAHYRLHSDDRVRSFQALGGSLQMRMNLDANAPEGIVLDFFPTNWGYGGFSAPGDGVPVAYFAATANDLRALSVARTISGNVLWTDFAMTPPQLDALRAFVRRVAPPPRRRP
jgi:hypothetical protein